MLDALSTSSRWWLIRVLIQDLAFSKSMQCGRTYLEHKLAAQL